MNVRTKKPVAIVPAASPIPSPLLHRFWPPAVLVVGFALTVAWTMLVGYGLFNAVALAF